MGANLFVCHFFALMMRITNALQVTPYSTCPPGVRALAANPLNRRLLIALAATTNLTQMRRG